MLVAARAVSMLHGLSRGVRVLPAAARLSSHVRQNRPSSLMTIIKCPVSSSIRHHSVSSRPPVSQTGTQTTDEQRSSSEQESDSDSDSDSEFSDDEIDSHLPYGKRGTSKLWQSKMRTYHRVMDVNKDGTVSWDDFSLMADKFIQLGHLDDVQQKLFTQQLRFVWENNWGASDDPYCFITEEALVRSMEHVVNTPDLCTKVHKFLPYLFKAVDYNCSGDISVEEHKLLFQCLGLKDDDAVMSFNSIDQNGDGSITLNEFVAHGRDFFISEDESHSSKFFWGNLAK